MNMDAKSTEMKINTTLEPSHLNVDILIGHWYEGKVPKNEHYDLNVIQKQISQKNFDLTTFTKDTIALKTKFGFSVTLERCCTKKWKEVGKFSTLKQVMAMYPVEEYTYGVKYNSSQVQEVRITHWNRGTRIWTVDTIPHGDNSASFSAGKAMWTNQTDDIQSKGAFYHRYTDQNFQANHSNGQMDLALFAKKH